MANFLSAVGRAQPVTAIQDFQLRQGNILGQEKKRAVADLQMKNIQQDIDIKKREQDTLIQQEEDALRPIAVEPLLSSFEGGAESPMAQLVYEDALGAGLIDMSQGGLGTINAKSAQKIKERMLDPVFASKLSRTRVDYWRGLLAQTTQALAAKPGDEKLQAEIQRVTDGLNQSLGQDKAMSDAMAANEAPGEPKVEDFETDFLDAAIEENMKTMSRPDAMKAALESLEGVKKAGKFEPKGISINVGDRIQEQEAAKDRAFWTGTKAKEKAKEIAREDAGEDWVDMPPNEKAMNTFKIMNDKIIAVEPNAKTGSDDGVYGWYVEQPDGSFKLIQRWSGWPLQK